MEKKYQEVLKRQGIDSEEIGNIWKQLPRTKGHRTELSQFTSSDNDGLYGLEEEEFEDDHDDQHDEHHEGYSDNSEADLAESISINLSPKKECDY